MAESCSVLLGGRLYPGLIYDDHSDLRTHPIDVNAATARAALNTLKDDLNIIIGFLNGRVSNTADDIDLIA